MKYSIIKKLIMFGILNLIIIMMESSIFINVYGTIAPRFFLFELSTILLLTIPVILIKNNIVSHVYSFVLLIFMAVFTMLNLTLNYASKGNIFSLSNFGLAGEAASILEAQYINVWYIIMLLLFIGIYVAGMILTNRFIKEETVYSLKKNSIIFSSVVLLSIIIRASSFTIIENQNKNVDIYKGMNGCEILAYDSTNLRKSALYEYGFFNYTYGELVDIIDTSLNRTNRKIDDGYRKENSYSDLLKDMNVITIMIETGTQFGLNETLTPNLWELYQNGINFNKNYTKNKTNISEYIGITGSATDNISNCQPYAPYSLPNILNNLGYKTTYVHDNYGAFYNRTNVIPNAGFENTLFVDDIKDEYPSLEWHNNYNGRYPLDTDFYEATKEYIVPTDGNKFYTFWTSLSTHGPYNWGNNINRYKSPRTEYNTLKNAESTGKWTNPYSGDNETVRLQVEEFECKLMVFDEALGSLIKRLKDNDLYDNTLLVLYGDHDIYYNLGIDKNLCYYIYDTDNPYNVDIYDTLMVMSNPKLNEKYLEDNGKNTYDDFTSTYMIVPTILDLLGVKYQNGYYVGKSIFGCDTELDNLFYSHELRVTFSDLLLTDNAKDLSFEKDGVSSEYKKLFWDKYTILLNKIDYFNRIYKQNFYKSNDISQIKIEL